MKKPKWWGLISPVIVVLVITSFIPLAAIYMARTTPSKITRLSIIPDMDNQPRFKAQMGSELFADGRSMRRPVEGTIARGMPGTDSHLTQGIVDDAWATTLPESLVIDKEFLLRGEDRYNIYCAMCHGYDGSGKGIIDARALELEEMAWIAPSNYHDQAVRDRPVGHIYNSITNGIRNMPAYGKQLSIEDRWAVVAWVRALQRSKAAGIADVPAEERRALEAMIPVATEETDDESMPDSTEGSTDAEDSEPGPDNQAEGGGE